jgi:hypothetical protein
MSFLDDYNNSNPSFGNTYDFSDIGTGTPKYSFSDPIPYATSSELNDPANQGFYDSANQPPANQQPGFLDSLGNALSQSGNALLKQFLASASSPAGIAGLVEAFSAARGLFDKGYITPAKGGLQTPINTALKATRSTPKPETYVPYSGKPVMGTDYGISNVTYAAKGGMMEKHSKHPRYLDGPTDGMADKIDTSIDDKHPAKLSHGEFVIPADVVSHLGNGNSTAGADVLYKMMERVRKARTGNPKQGKQIKPEKFTPGGIAGYANGGAVAFVEGGNVVQEQTVSNWAAPGVSDITNRALALSKEPTPVYQGPLVAGQSPLQGQAFSNLGKLTGSLNDFGTVQSYMNPYINSVMNQQSDEARRQSAITQTGINSQATQQNAFGGSRSAIMGAENNRNLGTTLANIQSAGLNRAYDNAMNQQVQAGQYGLNAYGAQLGAGGQQRGIEQQGIDAKRAQFEAQAADPLKRLQFAKDIFTGLPIQTNNTNVNYSSQDNLLNQLQQLSAFFPTSTNP